MLRSCTQVKKLIGEQEEATLLDVDQLHFSPEGSKNSYQTIQVKSAWYCVFFTFISAQSCHSCKESAQFLTA